MRREDREQIMAKGAAIAARVLRGKKSSRKVIYIAHAFEDNQITVFGSASKAVRWHVPEEWAEEDIRDAIRSLKEGDPVDVYSFGDHIINIIKEFLQ